MEEKAKVFAAVWGGQELIQFLAPLAILHRDELKNKINCTKTKYMKNRMNCTRTI